MILCNLSNLIAEKRTNISIVSRDTGISRTTLTSLCNNYCMGVQLDTVNKLCKYFDVGIEQLLLYSKYDIDVCSQMPYFEIEQIPLPSVLEGEYLIVISYAEREIKCSISSNIRFHYEKARIEWLEVDLELWEDEFNPDLVEENRILRKVLSELQSPFKAWLRYKIECRICTEYDDYLIDGYDLTINYPSEFK